MLASALALARGSALATMLAWTGALVVGFALTTVVSFALIPAGSDAGPVIAGIWLVVMSWAIGTTTRLAAWDEVGDRAAARALRVLVAFPWMFAASVAYLAGTRNALPLVLAAPLFGAVAVAAVLAMLHHALAILGPAAATVYRVATVTPRACAGLAVIGALLAARWMSTDGASVLELIVFVALLQTVGFSQVDAVVGVPSGAVRTSLGRRRGAGTALALDWPADAGAAQLEHLGVLDRSLQPRAGANVTLQRLPCRGGVRASRWLDVPVGGELWVAARWVAAGGGIAGMASGAQVSVRRGAHDELAPHIAGDVLARYRLGPGTWELEMVVSEQVATSDGRELAVWWALVEARAAAAA